MEVHYNKHENKTETSPQSDKNSLSNKSRLRICAIIIVVCILCSALVATVVVVTGKKSQSQNSQSDWKPGAYRSHITLLISLDGFRPDYLHRNVTPNLRRLASGGVKADFMYASFPTQTFPNHYSIVTGLYPESHGIVSNNFYDRETRSFFSISKSRKSKWFKGEPIWVTAMKEGLKTASYFWVGSEVPIQGMQPTYWKYYNKDVSWTKRVDKVIQWMLLPPDNRPPFITLYFEEPDKMGHKTGPDSKNTTEKIQIVDDVMGYLMASMDTHNLTDIVNVIVVSDHGMTKRSCKKEVYTNQMTANLTNGVKYSGLGALSMLYFSNKTKKTKVLEDLRCESKLLNVYSREDFSTPKRYHFTKSGRIGDLVLSPELHWSVLVRDSGKCYPSLGAHGYDNMEDEMKGIFLGSGPDLKKNYTFDQLQNVEIYNLLADLLYLTPAPNNGSFGSLDHILSEKFLSNKTSNNTYKNTTKLNNNTEQFYDFTPRYFPEDYNTTLTNCTNCVCYRCDRTIKDNLDHFWKNINLTKGEISESQEKHFPWGIPKSLRNYQDLVLTQKHYIYGYSPQLHLPLWAGYQLTKQQLMNRINRSNCFRRDIRLHFNESSHCNSYSRSGFDRGHIANSADFSFDKESQQDTFLLSNIVPQYPYFNRYGSWRYLESYGRDNAEKYGTIYVISGTAFDEDHDSIQDPIDAKKRWLKDKEGTVAIPTHFFKMFIRCQSNNTMDIKRCEDLRIQSFILPHVNTERCRIKSLTRERYTQKHISSVRDIELLTGLVFFPSLPAQVQARIKTKMFKAL